MVWGNQEMSVTKMLCAVQQRAADSCRDSPLSVGGRLGPLHLVLGMHSQLNPVIHHGHHVLFCRGKWDCGFDHDSFRTHTDDKHTFAFTGAISQPSDLRLTRPFGGKDPSSTLLPCTPLTWTSIRRKTFDASIWMALVMCWMLLARWGKRRPLFSHPPRPWWTRNRWRKRQGKANSWQN